MKFSYIVPVYNVEQYLRRCVDSLLEQDYKNYEIILVDDGSTDRSLLICDEYSQLKIEDRRLKISVIHQENGGLSAARNTGLKVAKGEYVCFVDSDDYWEKNVLGDLMEQVEREELDVLRFDYQNVRLKNERVNELESEGEYEVFEPNKSSRKVDERTDVVDGETYLNTRMGYGCYVSQFIIKRSLLYKSRTTLDATHLEPAVLDPSDLDNPCLFKEGIYFEDTEWTPRMLVRAKRVGSTQTVVYNYFWREGSITKTYSKEHIRKKIVSLYQVNQSLQQLLPMVRDRRWINGCIADNVYAILNNVAAHVYEDRAYWIDRLKKNEMLPLHGYKIREMVKLRYSVINISPRIYCWLRHTRMKYLR